MCFPFDFHISNCEFSHLICYSVDAMFYVIDSLNQNHIRCQHGNYGVNYMK